MPVELIKAHTSLDKAVDSAYGKTIFNSEAERTAFLFRMYQEITEASEQAKAIEHEKIIKKAYEAKRKTTSLKKKRATK